MAYIRKDGKKWRAEVRRDGKRKTKVFPTMCEATDWAAREEYIIQNAPQVAEATLLGELFDRYAREIPLQKRGARWEIVRLEKTPRDEVAQVRLVDLDQTHMADGRDRRLEEVAPGSVRREMQLNSAVLNFARREWRVIDRNPMHGVRIHQEPPRCDCLPTADEMERLVDVAGDDLALGMARAFHAFWFVCATAVRAGEIIGLTWDQIDLKAGIAHLSRL
ncbi:MAG: hypothetical protein AAGB05_11185 [Pseudomonadota bacterium]